MDRHVRMDSWNRLTLPAEPRAGERHLLYPGNQIKLYGTSSRTGVSADL